MIALRENLGHENRPPPGSGIERTGMLDAFAHDKREDVLVLAMFETRPWEYGELQLFQLQEKLNAYISFILDGEMKESFPHLVGKPVRVELRTAFEPSRRAMEFLARARDQIALQQIALEVVLIGEVQAGCSGGGNDGGGCFAGNQGIQKENIIHAHSVEKERCGSHSCGCQH
jgi:hypothetical protein